MNIVKLFVAYVSFNSAEHNKITGSDVITVHALNVKNTLWHLAAKI
jgi:hypothetical protein